MHRRDHNCIAGLGLADVDSESCHDSAVFMILDKEARSPFMTTDLNAMSR
jgi:hypothetical protein